jgi:hypothetical protein
MAITLVSNAVVGGGASGGTTGAINTTGASLLVALISSNNDADVTVSDSKGNTWVGLTVQAIGAPHTRIYYVVNPTVGTGHTFTSSGSNIYTAACFAAFSGVKTTSPFDQENGQWGGGQDNSNARPGSITPSENNELIIAGFGLAGPETLTIGGGYSITDQLAYSGGVNYGGAMAYLVQTTATATNQLWGGIGSTVAGGVVVASFKVGAGDATATPATVALTLAQPAVTGRANSTASPATATLVLQQPAVSAAQTVYASPATAALKLTLPTLHVSGTFTITKADIGSVANLTSETSSVLTTDTAAFLGTTIILRISSNNSGTNGAAPTMSVTDSAGNTYTGRTDANADPGAANAGVSNWTFTAPVTTTLPIGGTITMTYGTATTAKAAQAECWTGLNNSSLVAVAQSAIGGSTPGTSPTASIQPTAVGQLVYVNLGAEGIAGDTFTGDADSTDGSWVALTARASADATRTNNVYTKGQYKIVTGTTTQSWAATITSADFCGDIIVFNLATNATNGNAYMQPVQLAMALPAVTATGGGTDQTPTPATVALVLTQPAVTAQASSTAAPATVALVLTQPAVTATGGTTASPATAALVLTQPAVAALASSTAAPATVALTLSQPAVIASDGAYFWEPFNQADGAPVGWTSAGVVDWEVIAGRGTTDNNTGLHGMGILHDVDLSGDWEVLLHINASLTIGNGSVNVGLVRGADGVGYSIALGNASHVQIRTTGYVNGGNITNDNRTNRAEFIRWTYTASSNTFLIYHDGVPQNPIVNTVNTAMMGAADTLIVFMQETTSPTEECSFDNLFIAAGLGNEYPPVYLPAEPATVALALSQPPVTATGSAGATATPTTVALTLAQPAVTASAGGTASPTTAALVLAQPPVTAQASSTAAPATVALVLTQPPVTAQAGQTAAPATVALVVAQPPVTAQASSTSSPATVALVLAQPPVTAQAGSAISVTTVALVLAQPPVTAFSGSSTSPATVALVLTQPAVVAQAGSSVTITTVALVLAQPPVTAQAGQTASVVTVALILSQPPVATQAGATASPTTVPLVLAQPPVATTASGTASPTTVPLVLAQPAVTATGGSAGDAFPTTVALVLAQPAVIARANSLAAITTVPLVLAQPAVTASGTTGGTGSPVTVALVLLQPAVTASGGSAGTASPTTVALVLLQPAVAALASSTASVVTVALVLAQPAVTAVGGTTASPVTAALTMGQPPVTITYGAGAMPATLALIMAIPAVAATGTALELLVLMFTSAADRVSFDAAIDAVSFDSTADRVTFSVALHE